MNSKNNLFIQRQTRLASALANSKFTALALNPGPSLIYLTGLHFHLMERPVVAIFTPGSPPTLIIPELEAAKVSGLPYPLNVFTYGEDPEKWLETFDQAAKTTGTAGKTVGIEPTRLRLLEFRFLKMAAGNARFQSAETILSELRIRKDESEIAALRQAAVIAQRALQATLPLIKPGLTERQIASMLTIQLYQQGSDPEFSFTPIVSSGPNSANPHAVPSDRELKAGDLLVIDWGAMAQGYTSDITRTFAIGEVDEEFSRIAKIVEESNTAARKIVRHGIKAEEIDQAARRVIEEAGYGAYFIHRTGHGLGMEGHESPYIRAGNQLILEPGMVFTIEPGIYLPGRGGVRIEDDIVVKAGGSESLTDLPRQLITLP
ncbi:MAG: peptidase M24 [Chloroflexi bacterium RBG_16_54_18]|nr:MAG: peptidase M24 [Chloroflexi bacterium RBG_16_54_18]